MSLFCRTQKKIFWRMWETEQFCGTIDFHSIFFSYMKVNGAPKQPGYKLSSEYLPLCLAEQRNSYRFGTTWGWVNDDRIFIFGWTIPLSLAWVYALLKNTSVSISEDIYTVWWINLLYLDCTYIGTLLFFIREYTRAEFSQRMCTLNNKNKNKYDGTIKP